MGQNIDRKHFTKEDFQSFGQRLQSSLDHLQDIIAQPGFGQGPLSLGAEMEAYITTEEGQVLPINQLLIDDLKHPQLQLELNRFNIEYNLSPVALAGNPFQQLEQELHSAIAMLQQAAHQHNGMIVPIGILPTLQPKDLSSSSMTDLHRFHVLSDTLNKIRGEDFLIDIHGKEHFQYTSSNVVLEGANTSFQIHLRVEPERFADTFNTIQLVTPLVLALSANSPILLHKLLWEETRIALFKQSVDHRMRIDGHWREPARVSFGNGWVRDGAWELFAETVALHRPIMPILFDTSPKEHFSTEPSSKALPELAELKLHMGSIWPWNRAVYDSSANGHLRVEMRALPSGPTAQDMIANTALYVGLALGLRDYVRDWLPSIPFAYAEYNFYRAAQQGLDAVLVWPHRKKNRIVETPLIKVLEALLPYARKGLAAFGVCDNDIMRYMGTIEQRFEQNKTPSTWQQETRQHYLRRGMDNQLACQTMLQRYCEQQKQGKAFHDWDTP